MNDIGYFYKVKLTRGVSNSLNGASVVDIYNSFSSDMINITHY